MARDIKCGACGKALTSFETITVAGEGDRCYSCFNRETADRLGVAFDNIPLVPIVLADADGVPHTFEILSMLVPTGHEMEALEITKGRKDRRLVAVLNAHLTWLTTAAAVVIMTTWLDVPQLASASSRLASEGTCSRSARAARS